MTSRGMKYMHPDTDIDPRYLRQQGIIDRVASNLGCVAFRPNYHGQRGDKNTVLLYTKEDADFNSALEARERRGEFVLNDMYRRQFWSFENSDVNGFGTYDFANFGTLDLRGIHEEEVIEEAIKNAYYKSKTTSAR